MARRTPQDYELAALDYEQNPPRADEIRSIELNLTVGGDRCAPHPGCCGPECGIPGPQLKDPDKIMWQSAPYPWALWDLVPHIQYRDWSINLGEYEREVGGEGLTLRIRMQAPDSCDPQGPAIFFIHDFEVPARLLDAESWQRWVFDCIMLTERHEAMEHFRVDGQPVFFPAHDQMSDMYETKHVVHRKAIG